MTKATAQHDLFRQEYDRSFAPVRLLLVDTVRERATGLAPRLDSCAEAIVTWDWSTAVGDDKRWNDIHIFVIKLGTQAMSTS